MVHEPLPIDLDLVEKTALGAAHRACGILKQYFGHATVVRKKGEIDLVTQADPASEKAILETILGTFPDHVILGEEGGRVGDEKSSPFTWIIDPLDGTTNYAHHIPVFAVSIAFAIEDETVFGLVVNPISGELFMARKGQGAFLNGAPICVSTTSTMRDSLLVTGFPYNLGSMVEDLMTRFERCVRSAQGVRRYGSAALDLCFVACGRFDGFWEQNLHPWDTAAGACIVREAGGRVTNFSLGEHSPEQKEIIATNGRIQDALAALLDLGKDKR